MNTHKVCRGIMVFALAAALAALTLGLFAQATPPARVNYQGVLRDAAGAPLNGPVTMTFRLYDAASAGTLLWEEIYDPTVYPPRVTVSNGLFTVALGDATHYNAGSEALFPNVFALHAAVYLGVAVGLDDEMTPRIQVVSAPYALNSDTLDGRDSAAYARLASTGTITANWVNTAYPWADNEVSNTLTLGPLSTIDPSIAVGNADTLDTFDSSYFLNTSATAQTKAATLTLTASTGYGVNASGPTAGGYFKDENSSGYAYVGYADYGITAYGNTMGGYFGDAANSGYANVGYGERGIEAFGNTMGGYFKDADNSGYASVGYEDYGIAAYGNTAGGWFQDTDDGGYAQVGYGDEGIRALGNTAGGYFRDADSSGYAHVGYGDTGIHAYGDTVGGYFLDADGSYANVANGTTGISAFGSWQGGYFEDLNNSGYALVGYMDYGIQAYGNQEGGFFKDLDSSGVARAGFDTYKVQGTGAVSFIQNHPTEKDRVIVYACPEGDEVATYTRGTARLVNGEARVKLGETFQWVTNPDIGLTAHLTPRGKCKGLYLDSVSTTEMVVKELENGTGSAAFDYLVYGLRIGFEESSIVQEKQQESFIPSFKNHRERYAKYPELRTFNSLERFKAMESSVSGVGLASIDLSRATALKDAIHEYDPATDPPADKLFGHDHGHDPSGAPQLSGSFPVSASRATHPASRPAASSNENQSDDAGETAGGGATIVSNPAFPCLSVSETVEPGDVVVMDLSRKGNVRRCAVLADPLVVGIAAGPAEGCTVGQRGGERSAPAGVSVASFGIVPCKADASYGPIREGDLLVASPLPGYAMRADNPAQGTVIGKALEPLATGTGLIKVLVMLR